MVATLAFLRRPRAEEELGEMGVKVSVSRGLLVQSGRSPLLVAATCLLVTGCSDGGSTSRHLDPQCMANKAIQTYDANGDGVLDSEELNECLPLVESMSRIDRNNDGQLTNDEIFVRFEKYGSLSASIPGQVTVFKGGRPLMEADVLFEPEPFMEGVAPSYKGTTNSLGRVFLVSDPVTRGLAVGFYRVTITRRDGSKKILGCEIADDSEYASRVRLEI